MRAAIIPSRKAETRRDEMSITFPFRDDRLSSSAATTIVTPGLDSNKLKRPENEK